MKKETNQEVTSSGGKVKLIVLIVFCIMVLAFVVGFFLPRSKTNSGNRTVAADQKETLTASSYFAGQRFRAYSSDEDLYSDSSVYGGTNFNLTVLYTGASYASLYVKDLAFSDGVTTVSAVDGSGLNFSRVFSPSGSSVHYVLTALNNGKLTIYFTIHDSSGSSIASLYSTVESTRVAAAESLYVNGNAVVSADFCAGKAYSYSFGVTSETAYEFCGDNDCVELFGIVFEPSTEE